MFGIDSPELLFIAIVALVVIGPKELPSLLRSWGKWMAQMRGMASEFRGHVDEMVRQSELDDVKKQLEGTSGLDLQSLDPTKQIKSMIQEGVAEGEVGVILGANGAGKTTTLRAICNMVRSTGAIEFEGKPIGTRSTENVVRLGIDQVKFDVALIEWVAERRLRRRAPCLTLPGLYADKEWAWKWLT